MKRLKRESEIMKLNLQLSMPISLSRRTEEIPPKLIGTKTKLTMMLRLPDGLPQLLLMRTLLLNLKLNLVLLTEFLSSSPPLT